MRTFSERYHLHSGSLLARARRDARLAAQLALIAVMWAGPGSLVRWRVRRARANGSKVPIDRLGGAPWGR